jgi:hypothetical protein
MKSISPKVYVPVLISVAAAVALYLLTGDKTFLVAVLLSLAGGGAGIAVKPAPGVTQKEVMRLSKTNTEAPPSPPPPGPPDPPRPPEHRPVA